MAGSRPPGEKRRDEDTLNASRRSDISKYDLFWEPPPDERQAAWNKIAEAVEAYSVSTDASTLASLLREEAIVHFYMAEALERITDDPHQKSKAIEIKRSEAAQVESLPPRAVISEANYEEIRELVESGRRESVWEAFHTNPSLASDLIAEDAKIDQTLRQAADSTLTFLLQAQARVQLSMALALARIADEPHQKSRAIEILFHEAEQLTDRQTLCSALRWLESFEPLAVIPKLIAFLRKADDVPVRDAALETLEHLILRGFAADASEFPAAPSIECVIHFVEPPRVLISPNLTIIRSPGQTFLVPRKDASQEISLDHTAAPSPDLDLSSHQFTTNSGGDGFSPARSGATTAGVHADSVDLATSAFTTTDPAVERTHVLLVSESSEDFARLGLFEHGAALLGLIHKHQRLTQGDAQAFLDRLHATDLAEFSIAQKKQLAEAFNAVRRNSGLSLLYVDTDTDGNPTPITNLLIDIPNERSKGSVRVWSGRKSLYIGRMWPRIIASVPVETKSPLSSPEEGREK